MALRYLVLASSGPGIDPNRVDTIKKAIGLTLHHCSDELAILTSEPAAPLMFDRHGGCTIGHLFHRHGAGRSIEKFAEHDAMAIAESPAQQLLSRYWGGYVAVWRSATGVHILRDPSGLLPCCFTAAEELVAFASDPAVLCETGLLKPAIDWLGVATTLYLDDLPQTRTGLSGVSDLLAGSIATIADGRCQQSPCWLPWHYVDHDPHATSVEHMERLKRAVEQAARGWTACFDKSLLAVSGGLDSSVLAACIAGSRRVECLTLYSPDRRGDETEYAKELCNALCLPLTCRTYALKDADFCRSAVAHLPRPGARTQMIAYDAAVIGQIAASGGSGFLNGAGGDNVFYSTRSVRPLVDRYLATGLNSGLLDTLRDISTITEASIWQVAYRAIAMPRRTSYRWRRDSQFLHPRWSNRLPEPAHPWLDAPDDALPGKVGHIAMITRAQHYLHGYDRRLRFTGISPLLSQPVVEAALGIPSWFACEGGVDRAVARRAFAPMLPARIARRTTKGGPDGFAIEILRANVDQIRERLLDGALAANEILDTAEVEGSLKNERFAEGTNYVRLLLLLDTEAWVEAWRALPRKSKDR